VLGLTAGLCEESARYIGYRWLIKQARRWRDALMLGADTVEQKLSSWVCSLGCRL